MAEQWAFNPLVQGSTPWRPTWENIVLMALIVDRFVDRCQWLEVPSLSWPEDAPDT